RQVRAADRHRPAARERDEVILPRGVLAALDRTLERMKAARAVVVEREIVLARPLHLDRRADPLRDRRGLDDAVVREPPPESAAAAPLMHRDAILGSAEQRRARVHRVLRRLRRLLELDGALVLAPDLAILRLGIRVL